MNGIVRAPQRAHGHDRGVRHVPREPQQPGHVPVPRHRRPIRPDRVRRMTMRRTTLTVLVCAAALLCASMMAPAFGAPKAVSAVSLAKKLANTTKIANAPTAMPSARSPGCSMCLAAARAARVAPARPARAGRRATRATPAPPGTPRREGRSGHPRHPRATPARRARRVTRASRGSRASKASRDRPASRRPSSPPPRSRRRAARSPAGSRTARTRCPTPSAGGYDVSDSIGNLFNVMQNRPLGDGSGWLVRMRSGAQNPFTTEVWAVCVK